MEYFLLEHPSDSTVLCDRPNCSRVADYLELDGNREAHVCASHTMSNKHVSRLPGRSPNPGSRCRTRPAT